MLWQCSFYAYVWISLMNHLFSSQVVTSSVRGVCWAFVTHQSRSHVSRQLTNKLKQLCKICIVGPKPQKVTAHSAGNMTQSPSQANKRLLFTFFIEWVLDLRKSCFEFFIWFARKITYWFIGRFGAVSPTHLTDLLVKFLNAQAFLNRTWAYTERKDVSVSILTIAYIKANNTLIKEY